MLPGPRWKSTLAQCIFAHRISVESTSGKIDALIHCCIWYLNILLTHVENYVCLLRRLSYQMCSKHGRVRWGGVGLVGVGVGVGLYSDFLWVSMCVWHHWKNTVSEWSLFEKSFDCEIHLSGTILFKIFVNTLFRTFADSDTLTEWSELLNQLRESTLM